MRSISILCMALMLPCCSLPKFTKPVLHADIPQSWVSGNSDAASSEQDNWIASFGDETLAKIVNESLANNHDLQIAAAALDRAVAESKQARAKLAPTMNLNSSATRNDMGQSGGGESPTNEFGLSLDVSWEADVWGRIRAGNKAAAYDYYAVEYDLEAARQLFAAQTIKAYFLAIETTRQLALSQSFEANLQKTLDVTQAFYDQGLTSLQDTHVIKADLARAKESVQNAHSAQLHALRSLEILIGRYPAADIATGAAFPAMPDPIAVGIPSDVLESRPDIRAAERRVAAAFYRIEQAKTAKLPTITLTGSYGRNSSQLSNLTDPTNMIWNVAGGLLFPIFNAGKLDAEIDIKTTEQETAIANYKKTALNTFLEVETALSNEDLFRTRQKHLDDAFVNAQASEMIADAHFKIGEIDLLDLLQIKGSTITTNSNRIRAQRELLDQRVNLHLALGGTINPMQQHTDNPPSFLLDRKSKSEN